MEGLSSTTSSHYVVALVRHARRLGLDIDRMLVEAHIAPELAEDRSQWIDNNRLTALMKILWRETNDETIGIEPEPMRMGSWALCCDYMLAAENLGDLYRRGQRIYSYIPPASVGMDFSLQEETATVKIGCYTGNRDPDRYLVELMSVVWHRFPCWVIDEYIPIKQAFFAYPEPAHGGFYEELLQCDVVFDQSFTGFTFSRKYLSRPIRRSKKELETWLRDSPADLLYLPGRNATVNAHIRRELLRELQEHMRFPAFDNICEQLHMSSQVVRRRLTEEGTSYQRIKDTVRYDLSRELLAKPDLAIADIAQRTGFTEPAAFSRAFKKWAGVTPAQYREQKIS